MNQEEIERLDIVIDDLKCQLDNIKKKVYASKNPKIDLRERVVELIMENEALRTTVKQLAKMVLAKEGDKA